ncbi:MAG: restriction endonuclease subunit S [Lachnospiraceae bacterium]|nr:restriction endonuclease subunit S [Lachnospiraceae bacterium]
MANIPNIRFRGFTDDWERRQFSDFTWASGKRNKEDLDLEPYAITNEHGFIPQNEAHDDFGYMKDTDRKAYNIVTPNSFAYNPARINVGSIGYYEGTENVIVSSLYEVFQTADYVYDRFLWHWFKSDEFPKWIERLQEGSVRLYFYYDKLCECQMLMPSVAEQKNIAISLDNLDRLITLHQYKCDETKELKKYMLQKMFPQNSKKIPEIRFAGFTDDWEQCKLVEIAERVTRKNQDLESELPLTISAQYGLIDQNEFFDKRVASKDVSGYYLVRNGEFAYNKSTSSDAPWGAVKRLDRYEKGVLSTLYIVFRIVDESKIDSDYIVTYYDTDLWHKGVQAIAAEGARNHGLLNITPSDFFETTLMVPQDIDEQKSIGRYFKMLDNLIILHQRKCDELKEVKKFMLQNMFPQKG